MMPEITCYASNHTHSRVVCQAFAKGYNGRIAPPGRLLDGPAMVHGILRGCGEIVRECEWVGRDYFYTDHGYFKRGYYDGYFRVVRNGRHASISGDYPQDRWEALKVPLRPWKRTGTHVVLCPISKYVGEFLRISHTKWTEAAVREISLHTERPIIVKQKDGTPLKEALADAWCLVTHSSNAAVDAILEGIPVVGLDHSALRGVNWSLRDIESPWWPEREPWCWQLAYRQFTLDEIRSGGVDLL
ncbi:MAG: hypothetical protein ACR2P5_06800 [Gammaproteobacteria bacterium]